MHSTNYRRIMCWVAIPSLALACTKRPARDDQLVAAVILQSIRELPDTAAPGQYRFVGATTPDSVRTVHEATWAGWWHIAVKNRVQLPPDVKARFGRHFDLADPPADPFPELERTFRIHAVRILNDSLVTAVVGHGFNSQGDSPCTYTFSKTDGTWTVVSRLTTNCQIN